MSRRVHSVGFYTADRSHLEHLICDLLAVNGVDYPKLGFTADSDPMIVRDVTSGEVVEGATRAIDLPELRQITQNWQPIIEAMSQFIPDTLVTITINGELQQALNGTVLR